MFEQQDDIELQIARLEAAVSMFHALEGRELEGELLVLYDLSMRLLKQELEAGLGEGYG